MEVTKHLALFGKEKLFQHNFDNFIKFWIVSSAKKFYC